MKLRKKASGHFVNRATAGEAFKAFVPNPLPLDQPLEHFDRLERANRALGKLDGLSRFLPMRRAIHRRVLSSSPRRG